VNPRRFAGRAVLSSALGFAPAGSVLSAAGGQAPPPQAPVFAAGVEIVRLDVIVLDREGRPVTDLAAADFQVEEDQREQAITSFERVRVAGGPPPAVLEPPRTSVNRAREPDEGRCFFLFVDDVHLTPPVAENVRAALRLFLDQEVREGDWVTLMAPDKQLWWTARSGWEIQKLRKVVDGVKGLYARDPFGDGVSDWTAVCMEEYDDRAKCSIGPAGDAAPAAIRAATFKPHGDTGSLIGQGPASGGTLGIDEQASGAKRRISVTLDGLRQALDSLVPLRGHKSVILFSEGFVLLPKMQGYRELIDAARRANVAIHFIDPRGLRSGFSAEFQDAPSTFFGTRRELDAAGSGDLADATGGHTFAGNDPVRELRQVGAESEAYYLLGYSPDAPRFGERKLRVRVKGEGLTVHARSRYYVSRPAEEAKVAERNRKQGEKSGFGEDALLAMKAVPDATEVPLRASALFFDATAKGEVATLLAAEVPAVEGGHRRFKVVAEARRAEGGPPLQEQFESEVEGRPGHPVVLARQWPLPAGVWQARFLVLDSRTGKVGTALHTFEVPDPKAFRLSTPLVTDWLEGSGGGQKALLRLDRSFAGATIVYCQFNVYGASRAPGQVTSSWALRRGDRLVRETAATPIHRTPDGRVARTVGVSLDGAGPGEYTLVLTVTDEATGRTLTRTEAFTLS
jgi:VWFA-related protein